MKPVPSQGAGAAGQEVELPVTNWLTLSAGVPMAPVGGTGEVLRALVEDALDGGTGLQRNVGGELDRRTGLELINGVEDEAAEDLIECPVAAEGEHLTFAEGQLVGFAGGEVVGVIKGRDAAGGDGILVVEEGVGLNQLGEAEVGGEGEAVFGLLLQVRDGGVEVGLADGLVLDVDRRGSELRVGVDQVPKGDVGAIEGAAVGQQSGEWVRYLG